MLSCRELIDSLPPKNNSWTTDFNPQWFSHRIHSNNGHHIVEYIQLTNFVYPLLAIQQPLWSTISARSRICHEIYLAVLHPSDIEFGACLLSLSEGTVPRRTDPSLNEVVQVTQPETATQARCQRSNSKRCSLLQHHQTGGHQNTT